MVWLTRFDGTRFVLNTSLVELMEETPDTVITLTTGHHFVVKERIDEIIRGLVGFMQQVNGFAGSEP